ncbi:peptidoglycan editing factor PgeF [Sulfurimonas sp.]|uniref:peptidoglycan editing factor PgeF n=1 Tax=Sulfurimonas sp. TaxID=2022749 RepID=UPI002B46AF26|nr:peptidoglycan editing factor PgeF [Sulfurimonas sp.]
MQFYHSKLLSNISNITHAFTTIQSGNLAFHVNDEINNVNINHINLSKKLNYNKQSLIHMKQIHSKTVHTVDANDNFNNAPTCDALITDKINTPLMVMVADCSPLLFFDTKKNVIAVAHAGREGTFSNIVKNVINSFKENYNSNPKDIIVSIGASIKKCCYEVGDEIYKESCSLNLNYAIEKKDESYYLDISKILKTQLLDAGVEEKNIEISTECSCCEEDKVNSEAREGSLGYKYFSYRANKKSGRFCGVIFLK